MHMSKKKKKNKEQQISHIANTYIIGIAYIFSIKQNNIKVKYTTILHILWRRPSRVISRSKNELYKLCQIPKRGTTKIHDIIKFGTIV